MFKFKAEQKRFCIGGVNIGGLPGERPTVLIGTIFYHGQRFIKNETAGEFDRKRAEELINLQDEFSEKTGNPCLVDVVGSTPEAIIKFLDFTAGITHAPILIDGVSATIKIAGLEYAKRSGLTDRVIYNSLTPEFKKEEIEKIKEVGVRSAVLLAFNSKEFTSSGRVKAVKELLPMAYEAGVHKPLIDTCVMDIPSLGAACSALFDLKNGLGLPVGCGAHNAVAMWRGLRTKMGKQAIKPSIASAITVPVALGADFVLYGPIEAAEYVFPAVAMVDAAYSQLLAERGKTLNLKHPRYKIA